MIHKLMEKSEGLHMIAANSLLLGNSFVQWISNADTVLKLIGTLIAIPVAFYSAKSFYWNSRIKRAQALKAEKEISEPKK